jgi:hypothetical protein
MMSSLKNLTEPKLESKLYKLFEDVSKHIDREKDIDTFLDNTNLFDDWIEVIPEPEYPIFVMAVLNNIKRPIIVETIISSIINNRKVENEKVSKIGKNIKKDSFGSHPFS